MAATERDRKLAFDLTDHYDVTVSLTQDHQAVELIRDGDMLRRVICCCDCGLVHLMSINPETRMAYFVSEHGPVAEEIRAKAIAAGQDFTVLRRLAEERAARQTMAVAMQEAIDREVAARLKAEVERDEAVERADIAEAKWCGIEARLRTVIEAANWMHSCIENGEDASGAPAAAAYRRVRDAQASPEPEASKHRFTLTCESCGLPWSQHGGRDER